MLKVINVADVHVTPLMQTRTSGVNDDVVSDYAELLRGGVELPPITVYKLTDSFKGKLTLAIGFHRLAAHKEAGIETITAEVRKGTWNEAWLASWASNLTHGVRYSNADKREAVKTALKLFPKDSPGVLAEKLGVSDELVRKIRKTLITTGQIEDTGMLVSKDGAERPATISKVGQIEPPTVGGSKEPPSEYPMREPATVPFVTDPIPATVPQSVSELILVALDRTAAELVTFRPYPLLVALFRELDAAREGLRRKAA